MKNIFKLILLCIGLFTGSYQVKAQIINAGFETGLSPWVGSGNVGISTGLTVLNWTVNPGQTQMAVTEPNQNALKFKSDAELDLGLSLGDLDAFNFNLFSPSTNYSILYQDINLNAGQTVLMNWNFIARDYAPYNDGAIATMVGPDGYKIIKVLAVTANAYGSPNAIVTGNYGSTGWQPVTFTAGVAGTYRLGFACFNFSDYDLDPILSNDDPPGATSAPGFPILNSSTVTATACSTAVSVGEVLNEGGATITARGFVWNTTGSPTLADNFTSDGSGLGLFTSNISGLVVGQTYHMRAYATNAAGTAYGPTIVYTHNGLCSPIGCVPPNNITATPTQTSVTFNFNKATLANTTFIQIRIKGTLNWGGTSIAGTTHTFNSLLPNTTYQYRLRSQCVNLVNTAFTQIAEVTTAPVIPLPTCLAPANITHTVNGNNSVTVNWTAANNGALYFVQMKPSTSTWAQAGGASTASNSRTFNNLQAGTWYDYRIRTTCTAATTLNAMSVFSAVGQFLTDGGPALANFNTANTTWSVYPNPTNDVVNIEFVASEEAPMTIEVLDIAGRKVQEIATQSLMGNNQIQISLSNVNSGLYFIKATQNHEVKALLKVTKQ